MKLRQEPRHDEGFSLVEVVVSMLIFAVLSSAVVGLVVKTLQTTTKADNKSAASNLADAKAQYFVGAPWLAVDSGVDTVDADGTPWTSAAQGVAYTVTSTVQLVPNADNFCTTNGAELTRKLIQVNVTWPGQSASDKVTNSTFRRIYQADAATTPGAAAWQINTPQFGSGGTVTHAGLSGVTANAYDSSGSLVASGVSDSTGCVFISNLAAGSYSLVINRTDYVGQDNKQQQTASITVQAGKISVPDPVRYALVSSAKLSLVTVPGYNVPAAVGAWTGFSALFYADTISGYDTRAACTGTTSGLAYPCLGSDGTVGRLYPKSYSGYLGICADTKATATDFTPRYTDADVPTVPVKLGALQYQVTTLLTSGSWTVTATHLADSSCTGQTIPLGTTSTNTVNKVGVPQGTWTITAVSPAGVKVTKNITVSATAPTTPLLLGSL